MRLRISEPSPTELRVTASMGLGAQAFLSTIGAIFLAIGGLFVFSSSPHTDYLTLDRRGDRVLARKSQALAGRWTLNSSRTSFGSNTIAEVVQHEEEGSFTYQTLLDGDGGRWYLGKSLPDRTEAQGLADRINHFLADKDARHFERHKQTWWWFMMPFGLLGMGVGVAVLMFANHRDRWRFRRLGNEVVCRRHFLFFWSTRRWPLPEIRRAFVYQHTDKDGDTFNNVRLELRSGENVELCSTSHQMAVTTALEAKVERINRFLGVESQSVTVMDERDPLADLAEVEKQLQDLAGKNPRMAGLVGRLVRWAYQKRGPSS